MIQKEDLLAILNLLKKPFLTVASIQEKKYVKSILIVFLASIIYSFISLLLVFNEFASFTQGLFVFIFTPIYFVLLFLLATGYYWIIGKIFFAKGDFKSFMYLVSLCIPILLVNIILNIVFQFFIPSIFLKFIYTVVYILISFYLPFIIYLGYNKLLLLNKTKSIIAAFIIPLILVLLLLPLKMLSVPSGLITINENDAGVLGKIKANMIRYSLNVKEDYQLMFKRYYYSPIAYEFNFNSIIEIYKYYYKNILYSDFEVYFYNQKEGNLIYAVGYCNINSDCENILQGEFSCYNKYFGKIDKRVKEHKYSLEKYGLVTKNECECSENKCYYIGEPYNWMKNNIKPNSKVMMWWDFGNYIENFGLIPIVKNPSKSIIDTTRACHYPDTIECLHSQKNLESDEKIKDVSDFFASSDLNKSLCIAYKYNADIIFIESSMISKWGVISHTSNMLNGISDEWEELKIPQNINESEIVFSNLYYYNGTSIPYVKLIYFYPLYNEANDKYLIFKIIYPDNIKEIC